MNFIVGLLLTLISVIKVESSCPRGCDISLASYYLWQGTNLTFISEIFQTQIPNILSYNPNIPNQDSLQAFTRINVPFTCNCINNDFLGHVFSYTVRSGNTYDRVATLYYSNLTTVGWLERFNSYPPDRIPDVNAVLNVTVNCSCGDKSVSKQYGLFVTYPLRTGESLESVAGNATVDAQLLQRYNKDADFSNGSGIVFVPGRDQSGNFPPLKLSKGVRSSSAFLILLIVDTSCFGISSGAIAGISLAGIVAALFFAAFIYIGIFRRKKVEASLLNAEPEDSINQHGRGPGNLVNKTLGLAAPAGPASPRLTGITVDKSVVFSYEELAQATDDFSMANKIGQGGFGAVYYAELRGEVRLIGYCVEGSLFLVYEFIENGNLSEHLRGSGREPLPWPTRVQIALDSARGLEYIHEHTVPVYIHRDIKSANILIDKNFHGKVADFGLAKLTEVGSSLQTRLVGALYAQFGDVSPKVDVYAFGVVLYELISAKEAIVKAYGSSADSKGLVSLFEDALNHPDPREDLHKVVDPRLGENYPFDSVRKMAQLARACTQENPQLRPSMRSIVVALMTLSSTTEDWDVGSFYENQALMNLMSGR
ncbi:hypothetical protein IFM89_004891 [Coptis chinensis]|uniref:Protein kinase domain-containing protein n=1 Tax=Coptis chinensis TaxID=261450 RepID=A0A835HXK5_9MAGN|nr:hypothetical protein IFM89_004891 [Coptis chinensis]